LYLEAWLQGYAAEAARVLSSLLNLLEEMETEKRERKRS